MTTLRTTLTMTLTLPKTALVATALVATALVGCKSDDKQPDAGGDRGTAAADAKLEPFKPKPDLRKPDTVPSKPAPKISRLLPDNGFAAGGYTLTVLGENFAAGAAVYLDGQPQAVTVAVLPTNLQFPMPANPYDSTKPGKVSVGVMVNSQFSNVMDFHYTVSVPMTASFKGSVITASTSCFAGFPSDPIEGKVLAVAPDAGALTIRAEVGYSSKANDPSKDGGWMWTAATFSRKDGAYSVYSAPLTVPLYVTYDIAYRFSADDGQTWIYADTDETDLRYDPAKAAKLASSQAPDFYCLSSADCAKYAYEVVCNIDKTDKKKNVCVECLADADCQGYAKALGPKCSAAHQCGCAADTECAGNPNGAKCLGFCGCEDDTNCVSPAKCHKVTMPDTSVITVCK